jgi:hypothetical protein
MIPERIERRLHRSTPYTVQRFPESECLRREDSLRRAGIGIYYISTERCSRAQRGEFFGGYAVPGQSVGLSPPSRREPTSDKVLGLPSGDNCDACDAIVTTSLATIVVMAPFEVTSWQRQNSYFVHECAFVQAFQCPPVKMGSQGQITNRSTDSLSSRR